MSAKTGFGYMMIFGGLNLSMRADTAQDAFIEALLYYQEKLQDTEAGYKCLIDKVNTFHITIKRR